MKNNREIEVGQVRQVNLETESSYGNLYYIKRVSEDGYVDVRFINGYREGECTSWHISSIQEDIVVM